MEKSAPQQKETKLDLKIPVKQTKTHLVQKWTVKGETVAAHLKSKIKQGDECHATDYWNVGPCGPDNPKTQTFVFDSLEETQSYINYLRYKVIPHLEKVISQLEAGKCPRSLGHVE